MKICVIGAGNIGLALACNLSLSNKLDVFLYTQSNIDFTKFIFDDTELSLEYTNIKITIEHDLKNAIDGSEYVFCTYPAFLRSKFIQESESYYMKGCKLGFVPGYGGAEYSCKTLIRKDVIVFGFQRVPFVARQENKQISHLLSRKKELFIAALPNCYTTLICRNIEEMLGIPTKPLKTYMAVTLAPSNPLLHLTGLYNVFKNYKSGDYYNKPMKFYEEWNDTTSEMLLKYDKELQNVCASLNPLDLSEVVSLNIYYESSTPTALTQKLKSIKAFEVVEVPLIKKGSQYFPDFNSRMFTEDFPFGIAIIKYFGILTKTETPVIDEILRFYKDKTGICYYNSDNSFGKDIGNTGVPYNFGLKTKDEIIDFYRQ